MNVRFSLVTPGSWIDINRYVIYKYVLWHGTRQFSKYYEDLIFIDVCREELQSASPQ